MQQSYLSLSRAALPLLALALACGDDGSAPPMDSGVPINDAGELICLTPDLTACIGNVWNYCERDGEFLTTVMDDCSAYEPEHLCLEELGGCALCRPETRRCGGEDGNTVLECNGTGDAETEIEVCDIEEGFACRRGVCRELCEIAIDDRSYQGCEFFAADLDNAALGIGRDASSQPYAIVVSNPSPIAAEVWIEVNDAPYGAEPNIVEVARRMVPPGDLEAFEFTRREVDGSSSNEVCLPDSGCAGDEVCDCSTDPCLCRESEGANGMNDGPGTALTNRAYRVRSHIPVIAYQFNPFANEGVFSNDASMLIPISASGRSYTVVGWPQTIADADCPPADLLCLGRDFDPNRDDDNLRAFLTIVGAADGTDVTITLGAEALDLVPGGPIPVGAQPGDVIETTLNAFDVLNIETSRLNSDFTGTRVTANRDFVVFVGSEASDAPRFETYSTRLCCADHLEEQLFAEQTLGSSFMIARMPPRTVSLNDAFLNPEVDSVGEVNEPEYIRVVATGPGETLISTTLPAPDDVYRLNQYESILITAEQDFLMEAANGQPLAVLQALPSQQAVGIPSRYPGGDPAILAVPPIEQYRSEYVFLTPDKYAFDYVVITANRGARILLDGVEVHEGVLGDMPAEPLAICTRSAADGIVRMPDEPEPDQVIWRCQLSFPGVGTCEEGDPRCDTGGDEGGGSERYNVSDLVQNDGVHTIVATEPVGVMVYGFDAFVSYAYAAGLNLKEIAR